MYKADNKRAESAANPYVKKRLWDDFPDHEIKFIRNRTEFDVQLKNHFLSMLSVVPMCNRLLCPACHL